MVEEGRKVIDDMLKSEPLDTRVTNSNMSSQEKSKKPPTVMAALLAVLCDEHKSRGLSLVSIRSEVEQIRNCKLTTRSYNNLKAILRDLLLNGLVKKKSGVGLRGRMYLIKKERDQITKLESAKSNTKIAASNAIKSEQLSPKKLAAPIVREDMYYAHNQTFATEPDFMNSDNCSTPVSSRTLRRK